MQKTKPAATALYDLITGDEDARVCKDIPDESCKHQPVNFFLHLLSNFFTKLADEIASARLVFPWVLGLLGAPLLLVSLAVPIRESGVLLPQLFIAAKIRAQALRKYVWMFGGLAQWLRALGMRVYFVSRFVSEKCELAGVCCPVGVQFCTGYMFSRSERRTWKNRIEIEAWHAHGSGYQRLRPFYFASRA